MEPSRPSADAPDEKPPMGWGLSDMEKRLKGAEESLVRIERELAVANAALARLLNRDG